MNFFNDYKVWKQEYYVGQCKALLVTISLETLKL